ncbi:MAG: S8/S53 family peptidase [Burkholderiaceae bacterium]|nr:S8/S53 family peptidase [Burkholderiaceae bacterium]
MSRPRMLFKLAQAAILSACTLALLPQAHAAAAPDANTLDLGATDTSTPMTVSIVLKVKNPIYLDNYISDTVDPYSPLYHHFMSVAQFKATFAPSDQDVQALTSYLTGLGIQINQVYPDNLLINATGTAAQLNQAFTAGLHDYKDSKGNRFQRPTNGIALPGKLQNLVLYVSGLNTQSSSARPHLVNTNLLGNLAGAKNAKAALPASMPTNTGNQPGNFTTADVASFYGVNPLYAKGFTGQGRTLGIATLASFYPQDAYTYWQAIGLNVNPNRITQVHVDGGAALSATAGSGETSIDVEQSGGMAPGANIIVYDAPNTEAGFIDVFYRIVSDNLVDTLSCSWGSPEIFQFPVPYLQDPDARLVMVAYHQAFAEAAAQGISTFVAAGDSGAYDTNRDAPYPSFSKVLTVDSPASDPYAVAAGGSTVPATLTFSNGTVNTSAVINTEQVWGWDYLINPLAPFNGGAAATEALLFSSGGGGGVSMFWPRPFYQKAVPGIQTTQPNQVWTYTDSSGNVNYLYTIPANLQGRNLPDLALNADPFTGYVMCSTADAQAANPPQSNCFAAGWGGTSFVAPQLNGIFAVISQAKGSRLGLLHPQLYKMGLSNNLHNQPLHNQPLYDITAGDNWFYSGVRGYDQGSGLGSLNAAAVVNAIR